MSSPPLIDRNSRYLQGRHAVVTGGGRGIGAAIATELARLGATLTLMGRDEARLAEQAERLQSEFGGPAAPARCDVSDEAGVERAFGDARERFGDPLVLINNAGVAEAAPLRQTTLEMWNRLLAVNLTGTFLCSRAVLDGMLGAGWGRIVNIASVAGLHGRGRISAYTAAKHGVVGFTRAIAHEVASKGITVNAICPAYTDTEMAERAVHNVSSGLGRSREEARAMLERTIPLGRLIDPAEVASLAAWLCSPAAAAVTGTAIPVAGGEVG
jgi:NAD(P)-dependent dehydrogenase (short-subunit alcohol dehydrogenase family)